MKKEMNVEIGKRRKRLYGQYRYDEDNIYIYCKPIWEDHNKFRSFLKSFIKTTEHELLHQAIQYEFEHNYNSKCTKPIFSRIAEENCVREIMKEKLIKKPVKRIEKYPVIRNLKTGDEVYIIVTGGESAELGKVVRHGYKRTLVIRENGEEWWYPRHRLYVIDETTGMVIR